MLSLQKLQSEYWVLGVLYPDFPKFFNNELSKEKVMDLISVISLNNPFKIYMCYKDFVEYADHIPQCKSELAKIKDILDQKADLEQKSVKDWMLQNSAMYNDLILLNVDVDPDLPYFKLGASGEKLEKKEFMDLLAFCDIISLLYGKNYDLPIDQRIPCDPNDYYYTAPDSNEPSDVEKIQGWLRNC
ncbi:MAG: hypothetical protein EOO03_05250 [Chitinophagaceae bacterium]|nr:MAG: hypothetical protein EOO03_05250 [Chitinophagaceae bacterium]